MLAVIIIGTAICAVLGGGIIKLITDRNGSDLQIDTKEFLLGALLIVLVVAPLSGWLSYKVALSSRATYTEFLNGYETAADVTAVSCSRDGPCVWEYDCDPYVVMVSYACGTTKNPQTCYRPETHYHDCPYVTTEYTYSVQTTLGEFTFASNRFPEDPDRHRWRASEPVTLGIAQRAGIGPTIEWSAVKARLDSGRPGPVTKTQNYDNYVLASELTLLKQWSNTAARYDSLGLLPPITNEIVSFYDANKVGAVKVNVSTWAQRLAYLNSVVGPVLQGDVRLVVVRVPAGVSADEYTFALLAHWQNSERFGMFALPKNTLVVVLGTLDGRTVAWARASTGMPMGNEGLIALTRTAFLGKPLDPDTIIGNTRWVRSDGHIRDVHGNGALEDLIFGMHDRQTQFARVSMKAEQAQDIGTGYLYLKGEIRPSTTGWVGITIATALLCMAVWIVFLFAGPVQYAGRFRTLNY